VELRGAVQTGASGKWRSCSTRIYRRLVHSCACRMVYLPCYLGLAQTSLLRPGCPCL
jgi:hypothetical protein